jgi:hypothetical protein
MYWERQRGVRGLTRSPQLLGAGRGLVKDGVNVYFEEEEVSFKQEQ